MLSYAPELEIYFAENIIDVPIQDSCIIAFHAISPLKSVSAMSEDTGGVTDRTARRVCTERT